MTVPFGGFLVAMAGATARVLRLYGSHLPEDFTAVAEIRISRRALHSLSLRRQEAVTLEDRALALLIIRRCRVEEKYTGRLAVELDLDRGSVAAIACTARQHYKPDISSAAGAADMTAAMAMDALIAHLPLVTETTELPP